MKKLMPFVFLMLLALCACNAKSQTPDVPLADILDEILEETDITGQIPVDTVNLTALYGIDSADVEEAACCITMNGIFPDEILMIKAVSEESAGRVEQCLASRLAQVMNQSKSYDPESYEIAQKCHIVRHGQYVSLFVSSKHEQMNELYEAHFQ